MLARVKRRISAEYTTPSAIAGSTRWCSRSRQRHARLAVARDREPAEAHGEDLHQDQAEPEARDARAQHREAGEAPGRTPCRATRRRRCRTGMPIARGDQHREQREEEGRLRALGERLRHRPLEEDRLAEIAARELAQPVRVLHRQRLVEPERRAQLRDVLPRSPGRPSMTAAGSPGAKRAMKKTKWRRATSRPACRRSAMRGIGSCRGRPRQRVTDASGRAHRCGEPLVHAFRVPEERVRHHDVAVELRRARRSRVEAADA